MGFSEDIGMTYINQIDFNKTIEDKEILLDQIIEKLVKQEFKLAFKIP